MWIIETWREKVEGKKGAKDTYIHTHHTYVCMCTYTNISVCKCISR